MNLNDVNLSVGAYYGTFSNAPSNGDGFLIQLGSGSGWYNAQLYITAAYPVGQLWVRAYNSGQWYDWHKCT